MTNEFLHGLLTQSNELANHRKAENIEAQDLNFVLGKLTFYFILIVKKKTIGECMAINLKKVSQHKRGTSLKLIQCMNKG